MKKKFSLTDFLCKFYVRILLFVMYAPILFLIVFSFTNNNTIGKWDGFSLHLYVALFRDKEIMQACYNTFLVAISSAIVSTILGTLGAIGIFYSGKRSKAVMEGIGNIPVMNAEIVTALSLTILFVFFGVTFDFITLLIGHVVLTIPFVVLSVRPKLMQMNPNIYEAALDLGATPSKALRSIVLPEILPGVFSGFILSITLSLDDYIITAFTRDTAFQTLSTYVYGVTSKSVQPPALRALTTVITLIALIILVIVNVNSKENKGAGKPKHTNKVGTRLVSASVCVCMILFLCAPLFFSSSSEVEDVKEVDVLRVYNWQEYINEGKDDDGAKIADSVMELWEKDYEARTGKKVRVQYDTFETNETMLNTLRTGKTSYDLVCPSDYVIQKMILATQNGDDDAISIEKFDVSKMKNYTKYVSPYISDLFAKNDWTEYSVAYMWGTVGFLYNPDVIKNEDVSTWDLFWNTDYKNRVTCKDVSRDAYVVGSLYVQREKLREANEKYKNGEIDAEELQKIVNDVANDTTEANIENVGEALSEMKKNIYGFEVDTGKIDIVSGKIGANLAWSGDAVYAMDVAEEEYEKELSFKIPDEGSTIWFDGWVMPKGANVELAQDFVDFLCRPDIAVMNMDYIGYTSAIAGDEIFDLVKENYEDENGKYEYDLSYFFNGTLSEENYTDGKAIIRTNTLGRQLTTQYPSLDEVARCGIMEDFGTRNYQVLEMWTRVKSNNISVLSYFMMAFLALMAIAMITNKIRKTQKKKKRRR